jgi:DNA-binding MarR family transcriptional regulator
VPGLSRRDYENLLMFRTGLRRFMHWSETQARAVGLTPAQHQLLVAIKGHPDSRGPTISELAGYLLLRHHSVVELVDRAVVVGVVERQGDADDGRVTRVTLTGEGEAKLSRLTPAHLDELRTLAPLLDRLVAGYWDRHEPAAGPLAATDRKRS